MNQEFTLSVFTGLRSICRQPLQHVFLHRIGLGYFCRIGVRYAAGVPVCVFVLQIFSSAALAQAQVVATAVPARPPAIAELSPGPNGVVLGRSPTIIATLAPEAPAITPGQVVAAIDNIDVTAQIEISHPQIQLHLASALSPGVHQVTLTFIDPSGQPLEPVSWSFAVRDYEVLREGSLGADFTWNSEYAPQRLQSSDPNWTASANFHLLGKAVEEPFEATWDGNLRWIDQEKGQLGGIPQGEMSLVNGLLGVRYDKQKFQMGDLSVTGSSLTTAGSFARRGLKLMGEVFGTQFNVFGVRPEPVTGFVHVDGVNHSDNRIEGGSLSRAFFGEALRLTGVVINGKSQNTPAFNIGSAASGTEGTTYGLQLASQLFDGKLRGEAEWALSDADLALGDDIGRQRDQAWRMKIGAMPFGVNLGAEFQRIGRDFTSLANPTVVRDRESVLLNAGTVLGYTGWNLAYNWGRDNVRNDQDLPRVAQRGPTANFSLMIPGYPVLNLTYARSAQDSQHVPLGVTPMQAVTDSVMGGISYSRPLWNAFFNSGFTRQAFEKGPDDTESANFSLGFTLNPSPSFNIGPSYALNRQRNRADGMVTLTHVPTLTATVALVPGALILNSQLSFYETRVSSTNYTSTFAELLRVSWLMKDLVKGYAEPALSLRFNYNRTQASPYLPTNPQEWGIFVVFDLFAKFPLLPLPWQQTRVIPGLPGQTGLGTGKNLPSP